MQSWDTAIKASELLIEDKASGQQLLQELRSGGFYAAKSVVPDGGKVVRMHAQAAVIENGFVF